MTDPIWSGAFVGGERDLPTSSPPNGAFVFLGGLQLTLGSTPLTLGTPATSPVWTGGFEPDVDDGAVWTWAVGPGASSSAPGATRQLTKAYGRVATFRVNGHSFAQFSIDGRSDEAAGIVERRDDLWIYRDGEFAFRGRIVGAEDEIGSSHTVQFLAVDYRGLLSLAAKVEPPVPVFSGVDQAQIIWQLIQDWQALDGGNWGITEGVGGTSGTTRDESDITPFSPIGDVIDRLLAREGGGEWEIDPNLALNRWWPQRGSDNGVVLDHGGLLLHVRKGLAEFGNVGGATGSEATTAAVSESASIASDERGRWTVAQGFPSVSQQATVDDKAVWIRDQASTVQSSWRCLFRPRGWDGFEHVGLGDVVELRVDSGRIAVAAPHRVVEIQVVVGDDGTEQSVTAGVVGVAA